MIKRYDNIIIIFNAISFLQFYFCGFALCCMCAIVFVLHIVEKVSKNNGNRIIVEKRSRGKIKKNY